MEASSRLGMPLLVPGQGQKDVTHNEALTVLDMLVNPAVESRSVAMAPEAPESGRCWLVPPSPEGSWVGHAGKLACWMPGGWRFSPPTEGMAVWIIDEGVLARQLRGNWVRLPLANAPLDTVAPPTGGDIVDVKARTAIVAIIDKLSLLGLIEP